MRNFCSVFLYFPCALNSAQTPSHLANEKACHCVVSKVIVKKVGSGGGGNEIYIIIKSFCIQEIITFTSVLYRYVGSQRDHLPKPLYARLTSWNSLFLRILQLLNKPRNSPPFVAPECFLSCLQASARKTLV